jgi:hypothetical protein
MTANQQKHINAMALYMAVRHLSHTDAANALGKNRATVKSYRRDHPECCPPKEVVEEKPKTAPRHNVISHVIPLAEPSRSSAVSSVPTMRVSLPAPPWGGTFDRNGVQA